MDYWEKDWFIIDGLLIYHFQFDDLWGFCVGGTNINCSSQFSSSPVCYIKFKNERINLELVFKSFLYSVEVDGARQKLIILLYHHSKDDSETLLNPFFLKFKEHEFAYVNYTALMIIHCSVKRN